MPVMVHTGTSIFPGARNVYADPLPLDDVGVDFPNLVVILAHLGRPLWPEASFFLLRRHPNFWGDVSGSPPRGLLRYFQRLEAVADKLLWGTDWPGPMVPGMRENLDRFLALDLAEDVRRRVLQDNADRLFGPAPALCRTRARRSGPRSPRTSRRSPRSARARSARSRATGTPRRSATPGSASSCPKRTRAGSARRA